jgi:penicillin-binding protein 1A
MKNKNSAMPRRIIKWFWVLFAGGILSVALIFILIAQGVIGYMPLIEELENPIDKYASQVISADNELLGTYAQKKENRIYSTYENLSPKLVDALIATEDSRFFNHSGIDAYALGRAVVKGGILPGSNAGGGSTITQQLAKLLWSPKAGNVFQRLLQKPIEWVIAVQLERSYTKEEIINFYFNKFDFLNNAVGIQTAAWVYFGKKSPKDLSIEEAATLVGMCKNPSLYNPNNPKKLKSCQGRRNVVLDQMFKYGYLMAAEKDSLRKIPLTLTYNKVDHKEGLAPYFREYLRTIMTAQKPDKDDYRFEWMKPRYTEDSLAWETNPLYGWCQKNKKTGGAYYNLYTDGLKIYTTIDSRMQNYAEKAVEEHVGKTMQPSFFREKSGRKNAPFSSDTKQADIDAIILRAIRQTERYKYLKEEGQKESEILKIFNQPVEMTVFSWEGVKDTIMSPRDSVIYMKSFLRAGLMAMDPRSGHVKAYVGGTDYRYFQYDMINLGKRQIGSTIKPFLYSLAMEEGFSPCDQMLHVEQEIMTEDGKPWRPKNANKKRIGEMVTIKWGLQQSDNWVTAYLMGKLSPYTFARTLHAFGLKSHIDPVVSLCLGTCDASIAEMVSGYSTFVNRGIRFEPLYVTRIEDSSGNILASFSPQSSEVLSEESTEKMVDMLRSVVDGGTGSRMRRYSISAPMGGKTGTTQNHSDGWFMGFTPSLVGGVWVGGEDRSIHFDRMLEGQAASLALPVYAIFLSKVYADKNLGYSQDEHFPKQTHSLCDEHTFIDDEPYGIDDMFQ